MLIIANPTAGRGRGARTSTEVAERLRANGIHAQVLHSTGPGEAARMAGEAADGADSEIDSDHAALIAKKGSAGSRENNQRPTCIVACGGDGTVQEIAGALAARRETLGDRCPALGLAPAGRCNDFARALGVDRQPEAIVDVLSNGVARPIDLGRANGRYFCTVATLGADAEVSSFVDRMSMPLRGTLAYIYGAVRVLLGYRGRPVRIEGDFGLFEGRIFIATSANTSSYGGAIPIVPGATPTDGKLDLCIIRSVSRPRAFAFLVSICRARHVGQPEVRIVDTKRIHIDSVETLEIWADGEPLTTTPATIEVVPKAIRVMLPADSPVDERSSD